MIPKYYVKEFNNGNDIYVFLESTKLHDYKLTKDGWQTNWISDFIQDPYLDKYALKTISTNELIGLAAYRFMEKERTIVIEYMEASPASNPTINHDKRKYSGIGKVLIAFAVQLAIDHGFDGLIILKAKTTELRKHYIKNYNAFSFRRDDMFTLMIAPDDSYKLFRDYLVEE